VEKYKIHNMSEMIKPAEVPICTMDVQAHLENRMNKARELARNNSAANKEVDIDLGDNASNNNVSDSIASNDVQEIDLQKELERKFDELFGPSNKKNTFED